LNIVCMSRNGELGERERERERERREKRKVAENTKDVSAFEMFNVNLF